MILYHQNDDYCNASRNPIWYNAAQIDKKGWSTEMKIPFSQLKFGSAEEQV